MDNSRATPDVPVLDSEAAIDRAMATWDAQHSDLGMTRVSSDGRPTGFMAAFYSPRTPLDFGGSVDYVSDVTHCGWLPRGFFDLLTPGGGNLILGATFTIIFIDEIGDPIDLDGNGKCDVAWREIYYNDEFEWNIDGDFDIETVALHEAGHGLSQGHFGDIFRTRSTEKLHFAPRTVMNAAYSGVQQELTGTDRAGHSSNWASWPNN